MNLAFGASLYRHLNAEAIRRKTSFNDLLRSVWEPRPIAEYHEDMGSVLWWAWEEPGNGLPGRWMGEPPYVGSPNHLGFEVIIQPSITLHISTGESETKDDPSSDELTSRHHSFFVGGWPGYHTHWTPLVMPDAPGAQP